MTELSWEDLNRREAEQQANRQAKVRDLTDRLAKVLAREFSTEELKWLKSGALGMNSIQIEAFEIARQNARR